ncbi:MAG: hypothetical protein ACK6AH_10100, partial [Gemmatimonadota bacterium]
HEVSAITRRAVQSLAKDRMTDRGIPFVKLGRRVVYARRDVLAPLGVRVGQLRALAAALELAGGLARYRTAAARGDAA